MESPDAVRYSCLPVRSASAVPFRRILWHCSGRRGPRPDAAPARVPHLQARSCACAHRTARAEPSALAERPRRSACARPTTGACAGACVCVGWEGQGGGGRSAAGAGTSKRTATGRRTFGRGGGRGAGAVSTAEYPTPPGGAQSRCRCGFTVPTTPPHRHSCAHGAMLSPQSVRPRGSRLCAIQPGRFS